MISETISVFNWTNGIKPINSTPYQLPWNSRKWNQETWSSTAVPTSTLHVDHRSTTWCTLKSSQVVKPVNKPSVHGGLVVFVSTSTPINLPQRLTIRFSGITGLLIRGLMGSARPIVRYTSGARLKDDPLLGRSLYSPLMASMTRLTW